MKKSTKIIIPALALGILTTSSVMGVQSVLADDSNSQPQSIMERIAERFGLSSGDVQQVFNEERNERQTEMQQRQEDRLDQLVNDGKITEDQKNSVLDKCEEWRAEREDEIGAGRGQMGEMRNMTAEERESTREARQAERQSHRDEMEGWLEENGINADLLPELGLGGFGGPGGHGGDFGGPAFN